MDGEGERSGRAQKPGAGKREARDGDSSKWCAATLSHWIDPETGGRTAMGASPASARACMRDAPIHNLHFRRARTSPFQPPLRMRCSGPSCLRQCCARLRLLFRLQLACLRTPSEDAVPDGIPCRAGYRAARDTVPRGTVGTQLVCQCVRDRARLSIPLCARACGHRGCPALRALLRDVQAHNVHGA